VASEVESPEPAEPHNGRGAEELGELRELLVGRERRELDDLRRRVEAHRLSPHELADHLPEALAERAGRDDHLALALSSTIEKGLLESVERNPQPIATAVYPVIGPAIRMALAEAMAGLVQTINRAIEHSLSPRGVKWRLESWRTGVPFAQVVLRHALLYRVEQVFLIHRESGLLLAHANAEDLAAQDADLVSGMLTAIRDFTQDSFGAGPGAALRNFAVGQVTVFVEAGPRALLAAAVRGHAPPALRLRLEETLETVHLQYAGALGGFDGETTPFETARPLLAGCLETVLSTDRPAARSAAPRIAWSLLLLAVVGFAAWRIVEARRWSAAVAQLEREPGIVVVSADRGGGRWRFSGLRDPLAADPAALLAASGGSPQRVEMSFEPFLSFDPRLVRARAQRALAPPPSVELEVQGDTLIARGAAPGPWIAAAARQASAIPGIGRFDASALAASLPEALARRQGELEELQVLFASGSAALDDAAEAVLRQLGESYLGLRREAGELGYRAGLELTGRTDQSGSNERNRLLSVERAEVARRRLVELGVPADQVAARGIGSAEPLPGPDAGSASRRNRSVSVRIGLDGVEGR
jgi:OOP family OmpA-OmpF porin